MYRINSGLTHGLADTVDFIELLDDLTECLPCELQNLFGSPEELCVSRAPGRLDLMGVIRDYSRSLVLQLAIANAAHIALELHDARTISIVSLPADRKTSLQWFEMSLEDFRHAGQPIAYATASARFKREPEHQWAAYIAGAFLVLMRERDCEFDRGAHILISSAVPEGKGVSSSAALEV